MLVDDTAGTVGIEMFIAVTWPSPVTAVAETVRGTVAETVRELTGLRVTRVNVVVGPVVTGEHIRRVTRGQLEDLPRRPRPRPVAAPPVRVRRPRTTVTVPLRPVSAPAPPRLRQVTVMPLHPASPSASAQGGPRVR